MRGTRRERGTWGEDAALAHARRHGARLLARNYRRREGELDLVLRDRGVIAFAEVKARAGASHGSPTEGVSARQRGRIVRTALLWLAEQGLDPHGTALRFDVFAVEPGPAGAAVCWLRGAFEAEGW